MMALLVLSTLALADPTYDRLFADPETAPAAEVEIEPAVPIWVWPCALLGLGLVGALKLKRTATRSEPVGLRIIDRTATGDRGTLLVVEVNDGLGGRRRLLLGSGHGPPTLVADLGTFPDEIEAAPAPARVNPALDVLVEREMKQVVNVTADIDVMDPPTEPGVKRRRFTDEDLAGLPGATPPAEREPEAPRRAVRAMVRRGLPSAWTARQ